ncbi:MAG: hypothetical protein WC788_09005 [Candidatus Paceibacterota bacterium]|jgi:hypothetical protein
MKKRGSELKSAIIAAIDIFVALSLYLSLSSLLRDINAIRVPHRLFAFLSYFGLGIVLSIMSMAGLVRLIKIPGRLISILTLSSAIILMLSGLFVISILPYE